MEQVTDCWQPGSYPETGFWEVPPGFTSENLSKRGSGQPGSCGHQNCFKAGVHSMSSRTVGVNPLVKEFLLAHWRTRLYATKLDTGFSFSSHRQDFLRVGA